MSKLTATGVKSAKAGRHADGNGLYLLVKESGSKSWMLRVQVDGRRRDIGLGSATDVTLKEARVSAAEALALARRGVDPVQQRKRSRAVATTFETAARACHASLKLGWKNQRHVDSWLAGLVTHAFPGIGSLPVEAVDGTAVRDVLAPIWLQTPETARRILQRIGAVLDYAHINGWRSNEATLRSVRKGLPRQPGRNSHFDSMPYSESQRFYADTAAKPATVGRDALLFTMLTAVRSGETRFAVWPEFDLKKAIWNIPAARMKMNEPHAVPLSQAAVKLLQRRYDVRTGGSGLVFSSKANKPISDMTMTKVLRDAGIPDYTVHGFRSTFTDWAAETTDTAKEVVDKALAHKLPDRVEAAYRRTDFFAKRRALMDLWANFLADQPNMTIPSDVLVDSRA